MLNQDQIHELRQRVIRIEQGNWHPVPTRKATLRDGPLEGIAVSVPKASEAGHIIAYPFAMLTDFVTADYTRDDAGHWRLKQWTSQKAAFKDSPRLRELIDLQRSRPPCEDDVPY